MKVIRERKIRFSETRPMDIVEYDGADYLVTGRPTSFEPQIVETLRWREGQWVGATFGINSYCTWKGKVVGDE